MMEEEMFFFDDVYWDFCLSRAYVWASVVGLVFSYWDDRGRNFHGLIETLKRCRRYGTTCAVLGQGLPEI